MSYRDILAVDNTVTGNGALQDQFIVPEGEIWHVKRFCHHSEGFGNNCERAALYNPFNVQTALIYDLEATALQHRDDNCDIWAKEGYIFQSQTTNADVNQLSLIGERIRL